MEYFLGIDVGSVSTNIVCTDSQDKVIETIYIKTHGNPINSVKTGLKQIQSKLKKGIKISGVGVTGSARHLIAAMVGADIIKNEITAHAVATLKFYPHAKTIIEIGGQDSKIIILHDGIVVDFSMNNVCAAGTGSFLDQQASRLGIPIDEFGAMALESKTEVSIAGRCTVFAESDMIHKQQLGYSLNDIINGLCFALVRNYFNTVGKGKEIMSPIVFQGGVAANLGIRKAFEKYLDKELIIPEHFNVMGAIGAALLSKDEIKKTKADTKFKGFKIADTAFKTTSFRCKLCPNHCEIVQFFEDKKIIARFGDKCGRYSE
jgi:predicted CoA-substrate-specific enzyme activase